jgi:hypothetical protein
MRPARGVETGRPRQRFTDLLSSEGVGPGVPDCLRLYTLEGAPTETFVTLNPLRHEVQTHSRRVAWPCWTRTFCRFGFRRRRVALKEWLRALPKSGRFPQE